MHRLYKYEAKCPIFCPTLRQNIVLVCTKIVNDINIILLFPPPLHL